MKINKCNAKRLLQLARHIGSSNIVESLTGQKKEFKVSKIGANIEYLHWAVKDLPYIFKQWGNTTDGPRLFDKAGLNTLTALGDFFNLTADELFHLFVPGYQDQIYLGKPLEDNCSPDDWLHNVYQFLEYKNIQAEELELNRTTSNEMKKMKVKKLKYKQFKNEENERYESELPKMCA